jgi:sulfatase maturation enzyme AslB (radical SAM superfamily)
MDVMHAWGRILAGRMPSMSVEITRRCPLSCPGCYAFGKDHVGKGESLTQLREFHGIPLIEGVLSLVDLHRPLHLSIVGGEPLVRRVEITQLLPELDRRGIHTQIVTSAVRQIPLEWQRFRRLNLVVSIDGLQPEHDKRRTPATYERIFQNIRSHTVTVHCTVTSQMTRQEGYLREFVGFWSSQPEVRKIWMSLYTPQVDEVSPEILSQDVRERVINELFVLKDAFTKLELPSGLLQAYRQPPAHPGRCVFARTTQTISADLRTVVTPCQLGGKPDCRQCGCIAAAAMEAVNRHRLPIGIRTGAIYDTSRALGLKLKALRSIHVEFPAPKPTDSSPAASLRNSLGNAR